MGGREKIFVLCNYSVRNGLARLDDDGLLALTWILEKYSRRSGLYLCGS